VNTAVSSGQHLYNFILNFIKFIILLNLNLYLIKICVGYYKSISFADKVYQLSEDLDYIR